MAPLNIRKNALTTLFVLGILAIALPKNVMAQSGISVADIVTEEFLNGISNKATGDCPNRGFYTRQAFLDAFNSYPEFGSGGSADDTKREVAAFFAHATHETGYLCKTEEDNKEVNCDDTNYPQYPCNPSKKYYGRGPLQLTWNYNYAPAGSSNKFDGLNSPEKVASDAVISFKTALWFWKENVRSVLGAGFGETIRKINSGECNNGAADKVKARIDIYKDYCSQFGVDHGANLYC